VLRQAIQAFRKGGTLSIPSVCGSLLDTVPFDASFGKSITMKIGQMNIVAAFGNELPSVRAESLPRGSASASVAMSIRSKMNAVPMSVCNGRKLVAVSPMTGPLATQEKSNRNIRWDRPSLCSLDWRFIILR
jgi:hypothetical protein